METDSTVLVEEGDMLYYRVTCRSFHLTSFGVLLDVYGVTDVISYTSILLCPLCMSEAECAGEGFPLPYVLASLPEQKDISVTHMQIENKCSYFL